MDGLHRHVRLRLPARRCALEHRYTAQKTKK